MIAIPYGKGHLDVAFPYNGLLTSRVDELKSDRTGRELVEEAMAHNDRRAGSKAGAGNCGFRENRRSRRL